MTVALALRPAASKLLKLDIARDFIASSVSDLEAAGRSASATHCLLLPLQL